MQCGYAFVSSVHFPSVKQNGWVSKCPSCCNANTGHEGQPLHSTAHSSSASRRLSSWDIWEVWSELVLLCKQFFLFPPISKVLLSWLPIWKVYFTLHSAFLPFNITIILLCLLAGLHFVFLLVQKQHENTKCVMIFVCPKQAIIADCLGLPWPKGRNHKQWCFPQSQHIWHLQHKELSKSYQQWPQHLPNTRKSLLWMCLCYFINNNKINKEVVISWWDPRVKAYYLCMSLSIRLYLIYPIIIILQSELFPY